MTVGNRLLNYYASTRPGAAPTPVYTPQPAAVQPAQYVAPQPTYAPTTYTPSYQQPTYYPPAPQPVYAPQPQVQDQFAQAMAALQAKMQQVQQALGQAVNNGQAQIASITQPQPAYYPQPQPQYYPQPQPQYYPQPQPVYYPQQTNVDMQRIQAQLNQAANQGAQVVNQLATSIQGIANAFKGGQQQPYPYYR